MAIHPVSQVSVNIFKYYINDKVLDILEHLVNIHEMELGTVS